MQKLIKLVEQLLEDSQFFISCIELERHGDNSIDGEEFERELRGALAEAKAAQDITLAENVFEFVEVKEGVIAELNGAYYHQYEYDRQTTIRGFGPIDKADISDPKFCKVATDKTYKDSYVFNELAKAKLVPVKLTTTKTYVLGIKSE